MIELDPTSPWFPDVKTLIIGYGNPLRSDDGLGWTAAQRLAAAGLALGVLVLARTQLTPELAAEVSQSQRVIWIDAVATGTPGTVQVSQVCPSRSETARFAHHLTPGSLLALAQTLYHSAPTGYLVSVAAANLGYGETLSPPVQSAINQVLARVRELVIE